jgi:CRISPR system Cascade subunit CasE
VYLTQLILNPRSRRARAELTQPYEMHRTLMRAFGDDLTDERVLYRVDIDRTTGTPLVLVQSCNEPDWSFLEKTDSYLLDNGDEENPTQKRFSIDTSKGQALVFRLRANPTVKRNGKRLGLFDEQDQLAWLQRKAEQGGFQILSATVRPEGLEQRQKHDKDKQHGTGESVSMTHYAVRFDGHLRVTDPELFAATIAAGIGPAKAFGFGLLSVAPV